MAGQQLIPHQCSRFIAQQASIALAPSCFSPVHVILMVFAPLMSRKLLNQLNTIFSPPLRSST